MSEIGFYHLTRSGADEALPPLLGRTLAAGKRAVVRCSDQARVAAIDAALWRAPEPVWLPHGTAQSGYAALQPIWITAEDEVPNGASFLFLLDGVEAAAGSSFERVFDLFDGNDPEQVRRARDRWTAAKARGDSLTYWRQDAKGWSKAR